MFLPDITEIFNCLATVSHSYAEIYIVGSPWQQIYTDVDRSGKYLSNLLSNVYIEYLTVHVLSNIGMDGQFSGGQFYCYQAYNSSELFKSICWCKLYGICCFRIPPIFIRCIRPNTEQVTSSPLLSFLIC